MKDGGAGGPADQVQGQADGDPRPEPHEVAITDDLAEGRARGLKQGDSFAVVHQSGSVRADTVDGFFHLDTRHLSRLEVRLNGAAPILLSSMLREDNTALVVDLTNGGIGSLSEEGVGADTIHLRRMQCLWDDALHERIRVRNYADRPVRVEIEMRYAADFADIFEVRGSQRDARGDLAAPEVTEGGVRFAYRGRDDIARATDLRLHPVPERLEAGRAVWTVDLAAGAAATLFVEARATRGAVPPPAADAPPACFYRAYRAARRALRETSGAAAAISSDDAAFDEVMRRAIADLYMLTTRTEHGLYPYAGVPWFSTPFGRDALITAHMTLWLDPAIAEGTLRYLAANQADAHDPAADAEPGKILHEVRRGEMAETGEVPFRRYYGSVDSTPLFVWLAGAHLARTGDLELARDLWPHIRRAVTWMEETADAEGFLPYGRKSEDGLANQGWKDSWDSVFHADGTLARGPIAIAEVQGYAHAALVAAAEIAEALGEDAADWRARADALRDRFDAVFWMEDRGTYALALDGARKPCRVRASNAGHALWTGIALPSRAARLAATLMAPASFSGWGIRTVPRGEARYNPMSYHDGSVWPHDTALCGIGLARYGHREAAARLLAALVDAAGHLDLRRLPELFCGFDRMRGQGPTSYPVACAPQAWAAAAPLGLVGALLGLSFDCEARCVSLGDPILPPGVDALRLRGLAAGPGRVDLTLRRTTEGAAVAVERAEGGMHVVTRHGAG